MHHTSQAPTQTNSVSHKLVYTLTREQKHTPCILQDNAEIAMHMLGEQSALIHWLNRFRWVDIKQFLGALLALAFSVLWRQVKGFAVSCVWLCVHAFPFHLIHSKRFLNFLQRVMHCEEKWALLSSHFVPLLSHDLLTTSPPTLQIPYSVFGLFARALGN